MISVFNTLSQTNKISERKSFDYNLSGECIIKSTYLNVNADISNKNFEIEVPNNGEYFLSAWVMGFHDNNSIKEFNVFLTNRIILLEK